jgi:hypothetical protein
VDNGYNVCITCGCVMSKSLDTRNVTFDNSSMYLRPTYSRQCRFVKKILASLNRGLSCEMNLNLLKHLSNAKTPEDILEGIRTWPKKKVRKPYTFAAYYGRAMDLPDITMSMLDRQRITIIFEEIFFAHKRLNIKGPNYPFSELLHLIVQYFEMDSSTMFAVRYAKRLRCPIRTNRYREMFFDCIAYIAQHDKLDLHQFKCTLLKSSAKTNRN